MTPLQAQITTAKFLRKHPGKWHSFATDRVTVESVCGLHNLGIAKVNDFGQMRLRSADKADRFVNNHYGQS